MTSSVSIVSDFVANGHQIIPNDSCSPSKIPYGGFSRILCAIAHNVRYVKAALMLRSESKFLIFSHFGTCGHHISEVPDC